MSGASGASGASEPRRPRRPTARPAPPASPAPPIQGKGQVNGKTCYNRRMQAGHGKQLCGQKHGGWHEEKYKVTCTGDAKNGQFTVRVYTTLNSAANDESFGIDNAVLTKA